MSRGLRILHLADTHIGADLPARPRVDRARRGDDFVDALRRVLRLATSGDGVDLVIHAGDLYDNPHPSGAAVAAACEPILEVASQGVPVVIVPGNHERCAIPSSILLAHENVHIIREPATLRFTLRGLSVAIAAFPCVRRESAARFGEALAAAGGVPQADVRILAVHQTFESATCGPANFRFRSGSDVVERASVPREFHYVAAGHVHRHQRLEHAEEGGPPIVYCGSPERVSFAEVDEPKGCVLVDVAPDGRLTPTFVEHAVRPMRQLPLDVTGLARARIIETVERWAAELPKRCVALVRMTGETVGRELRGLMLAERLRRARGDIIGSVSMQAVKLVAERVAAVRSATPAGFSTQFATGGATTRVSTTRTPVDGVAVLPNGPGVYAFVDGEERLLYIGKAKRLRTRVRSHLTRRVGNGYYAGWLRQIALVEVREARSELEALLLEADLVRRLRPPFNSQMRSWERYCYLTESGEPYSQLSIAAQATGRHACFGPLRSRWTAEGVVEALARHFGLARCPHGARATSGGASDLCERYFGGACSGPCAGRIAATSYAARVAARDALLRGDDEAGVLAAEAAAAPPEPESTYRARQDTAAHLRFAFDSGRLLSAAEALAGGLLLLAGDERSRPAVTLGAGSFGWEVLEPTLDSAAQVLSAWQRVAEARLDGGRRRLNKSAVDAYCVLARQLHRCEDAALVVPAASAAGLTARGLLAAAGYSRRGGRRKRFDVNVDASAAPLREAVAYTRRRAGARSELR